MTKQLRALLAYLRGSFGLVPGLMVFAGAVLGIALVAVDRAGLVPGRLIDGGWLYDGGGTGARTLLGVVAGSVIGVAGTAFSITIAALTLAAGQMGPRLLRNFTRDRGNQITLGIFLGTFSYALMVLRSVRVESEGDFVPHLAMSVSILLAFVSVGTLVYFVGHMAGRINVDTVIDLVSAEVKAALERIAADTSRSPMPAASTWRDAAVVSDPRHGYLDHVDADLLAEWAHSRQTRLRLLVRPGDFVFPGAPIAVAQPAVSGMAEAIRDATTLQAQRSSAHDLEYDVRQLVEVAVRALSPGINDPNTALNVLDRLGAALCDLVPLTLPNGVHERGGRCVLVVPAVDYAGLVDAMFHLIRQYAAGSPAVLIRMFEVLTAVASCERADDRLAELARHAGLIIGDAERDVKTPADLADLRGRHGRFAAVRSRGVQALADAR